MPSLIQIYRYFMPCSTFAVRNSSTFAKACVRKIYFFIVKLLRSNHFKQFSEHFAVIAYSILLIVLFGFVIILQKITFAQTERRLSQTIKTYYGTNAFGTGWSPGVPKPVIPIPEVERFKYQVVLLGLKTAASNLPSPSRLS